MARWIAFDQQTSSFLRSSLARRATVETLGRGPVDYALAKPGVVVTLLPSTGSTEIGIAIFRRPRQQIEKVLLPSVRSATRAGGFLGLNDELASPEEPVEPKKGWWRKLWDE